jgi:hypothetical protein
MKYISPGDGKTVSAAPTYFISNTSSGTLLKDVHYEVAGAGGYRGDLVLTPDKVYFFPHTDVGSTWLQHFAPISGIRRVSIPLDLILVISITAILGEGFGLEELAWEYWVTIIALSIWLIRKTWEVGKRVFGPKLSLEQQIEAQADYLNIILEPEFLTSKILDRVVEEKKKMRRRFSAFGLPLPMSFQKSEIKNLTLTRMGTLIFETPSDTHKFYAGLMKKSTLEKLSHAVRTKTY